MIPIPKIHEDCFFSPSFSFIDRQIRSDSWKTSTTSCGTFEEFTFQNLSLSFGLLRDGLKMIFQNLLPDSGRWILQRFHRMWCWSFKSQSQFLVLRPSHGNLIIFVFSVWVQSFFLLFFLPHFICKRNVPN